MELYLDSTNPAEIREVRSWGLLSGVTTNPMLMGKAGPDPAGTLAAVLEASPGPVFCQVIGWHAPEPLIAQAKRLHAVSDRIIVKLPMSVAGIQALLALKCDVPGLRLCITAVASISQAYLAGKAGADVVALFDGPLDQASDNPVDLVTPVRAIFRNYGFATKILSCGRYPRSFAQFAVAGSDICTMKFEFWKLLYEHAFTDQRMLGFMRDWEKGCGSGTWLEANLEPAHGV